MPQQAVLRSNFFEFAGVDYRANDATRKSNFARDALNVEWFPDNTIGARPGCKVSAPSQGGCGLGHYIKRDENGVASGEVVTLGSELYRRKTGTLTITAAPAAFGGAGLDPYVEVVPELTGSQYHFSLVIVDNATERLRFNLGNGFDDATPPTIAQLAAAINALTNYTAATTGTTSVPAVSLPLMSSGFTSPVVMNFSEWEQVYCPINAPFSDLAALSGTDRFKLADFLNIGNRLFIATGNSALYKYDGVSLYKAGMPTAGFNTQYAAAISGAAGTGTLTGTFTWAVTYSQHDSARNIVEGDTSNEVTLTLSSQGGAITIPYLQPSSGFLTSCGTFNNGGTQTGTTLTVSVGHTLQVGQTAFFIDNAGAPQEREITATTATSITLAGAAVTVANAAPVSANLRVRIYRTKAGGAAFFLVDEIPNNSLAANIVYTDTKADSLLLEQYVPPINGHGLPPENLWSLAAYQNSLCGATLRDDQFYVSDPSGPEYFGRAQVDEVKSASNEPISGLGANREVLVIFKPDEIHIMQGSLPDAQYVLEKLVENSGTLSKDSIVEVDGTLWFWSSNYGPQRILGNKLPDDVGYRILPAIKTLYTENSRKIVHKRVVAANYAAKQQVIFYVPSEDSNFFPNSFSKLYVADYRSQLSEEAIYDERGIAVASVPRVRWWPWNSWNIAGGAAQVDGLLVWQERRYSSGLGALETPVSQQNATNFNVDSTDHAGPFSWRYEFGWESLGEVELLKKFNRYVVYSLSSIFAPSFSVLARAELRWDNGSTFSEKLLNFGDGFGGGFGIPPFGVGPFGDPISPRKIFPLTANKAQSIKLILERTIWQQRPAISGVVLEAVPVFKPKVERTRG